MSYPRETDQPRRLTHDGPLAPAQRPLRPVPPGGPGGVQIDPKMVLMAIHDSWKWALPIGIFLTGIAVAVIVYWWEPVYEAYAWVRIQTEQPYLAYEPSTQSGSGVLDRFIETQKDILRSRSLLTSVLKSNELRGEHLSGGSKSRANPAEGSGPITGVVQYKTSVASLPELAEKEDQVAYLREALQLTWGKSEFLRVAYQGRFPADSARIVNTVVQQFILEYFEEEDEKKAHFVSLLDDEITVRERELGKQRERLREKIEETPGAAAIHLSSGAGALPLATPLAGLLTQKTEAEVEIEVLKAQIEMMRMSSPDEMPVSEAALRKRIESDLETQRLQHQIAALSAQLHETQRLVSGGPDNERCLRIELEREEMKGVLKSHMAVLETAVREELREEMRRAHEADLAKAEAELNRYEKKLEVLETRYKEERANVQTDNTGELAIQFMQAELAQQEEVLQRISARRVELQTERKAPQRISVYEPADVPTQPVAAYPIKEVGVAVVGCMGFPFGIAVLLELLRRRIRSVESLHQISHLPVVGEIAQLPRRRIGTPGGASSRSVYLFEESFNALRTKLILSEEWKDARIFAVTSAVNNEGKTSVCSQLAMSTARSRKGRVLLVDCDTRLPDLHKYFDAPLGPGLTDVLRGDAAPGDCINQTSLENFDVLCAGELKESPHSLFSEENFARFLQWAASRYEFVFLDTPPILAAAESLVVAKIADASLVCAMLNISRSDQIEEACKRLAMVGSPSVGAVLNGVPFHSYTSRYGEYAYYETARAPVE